MRFIAPSLVAINIMNNAFFENTFGSFVRMYYQKTFDAMMATPLNAEEIITGEIVWGATKAVIGTVIMLIVISFFGLVSYPIGNIDCICGISGRHCLWLRGHVFYQHGEKNRIVQSADFFIHYPHVSFQRHVFPDNQFAALGAIFRSYSAAYPSGQSCPGIEFWLI